MIEFDIQTAAIANQDEILYAAIATHFGVTKEQIISASRKKEIVFARYIFVLICFTYFCYPHWKIAEMIYRNRSTMNHSLRTATYLIAQDDLYKSNYNKVIQEMRNHEKNNIK